MTGRTVWLASYPKSGNTWCRAVYSAWRRGGPPDLGALGTIASSRERFDDALGVASSDLTPREVERLRPTVDDVVDAEHHRLHLEKVHDRPAVDDRPVVSAAATHCALYLVRDPRDVAVSLAFHNDADLDWATATLNDPDAAISDSSDDIGDQLPQRLGTWSDHVCSWVDGAPFPVHVLRYEDCLADPVRAFTAAFDAAGFDATPDDLAAAVARSSFGRLAADEERGRFREARSRVAPFFRAGRAGEWRTALSAAQAARIVAAHRPTMDRFGYLDVDGASPRTAALI